MCLVESTATTVVVMCARPDADAHMGPRSAAECAATRDDIPCVKYTGDPEEKCEENIHPKDGCATGPEENWKRW